MAEWKRLEEEARKKQEEEETWQREEDRQRDLAKHLEADRVAAVEQQRHKNWIKTFLPPLSLPSDKEMNLIDLPRGNVFDTCHKKLWRLTNDAKSWQGKWGRQLLVGEVRVRGARTSVLRRINF